MAVAAIAHRRGWKSLVSMSNRVRKMSELVQQDVDERRAILLDALSLVKRLEGLGVSSKHAEASSKDFNYYPENVLNERRAVLMDALSLVRRLEGRGVPSNHAEEITKDFNYYPENVSNEKTMMEHHFSLLQREIKELRVDIKNFQRELRYKIGNATADQYLDFNLERWRLREELAKHSVEISELTNELVQDIHALKPRVIKFWIATISISAIGVTVIKKYM